MKKLLTSTLCTLFFVPLLANHFQVINDSLNLEKYLSDNNVLTQKTKEGIYYTFEREGHGEHPKRGDFVVVNFKGKLLDGQIFDESEPNEPFVFQVGYRQVIRGWDLGVPLFKVGNKGTLYLPPELAYGKSGVGNVIPPNAPLVFEIELLKIMNVEEYDQYMVKLEDKERRDFELKKEAQFRNDLQIIRDYVKNKKLKVKRTNSGLSYVVKKKGKKVKAEPGNILTVHYEGQLVDGTVFSRTFGKAPFEFQLGKGKAIEGWEEGLQYFSKGQEGWILIPSKMAYGPRAIVEKEYTIPANSVLIFKIKVVDIKKSSKGSEQSKS